MGKKGKRKRKIRRVKEKQKHVDWPRETKRQRGRVYITERNTIIEFFRGKCQYCHTFITSPLKSDSHLPKKLFYLLQLKPLKNREKCFLVHLKNSFHFQDI